jgi:outer membrane protein TolC
MSKTCRIARQLAHISAFVMTLSSSPCVEAQPDAQSNVPVSQSEVIRRVLANNPAVAAEVAEARRAASRSVGEAHRRPFFLSLDTAVRRDAQPVLGPDQIVLPRSMRYAAGTELKRSFSLGTSLSLRIEGFREESVAAFTYASPDLSVAEQVLVRLGPAYGTNAKLTLTQPLLRGAGRDVTLADLHAARADRTVAEKRRDRVASQVVFESLTTYWELAYASRAVEIHRDILRLARDRLAATDERIRIGSVAETERLTLGTRLAELEEQLVKAESEQRQRAIELARVLGDESLAMRRAEIEEPRRRTLRSDCKDALRSSPLVDELTATLQAAVVRARTAADALRPRLDLEASAQAHWLALSERSPIVGSDGQTGVSAFVTLTYEMALSRKHYRSEKRSASLSVEAARQRLHEAEQKICADLAQAVEQKVAAERRIDLSAETREMARAQLTAEEARLRIGSTTALQVRAAEEQLLNALLRSARSDADLMQAQVRIQHIDGTLLERLAP